MVELIYLFGYGFYYFRVVVVGVIYCNVGGKVYIVVVVYVEYFSIVGFFYVYGIGIILFLCKNGVFFFL